MRLELALNVALALVVVGCSVEHSVGEQRRCLLGIHVDPDATGGIAAAEALAGRPFAAQRLFRIWDQPLVDDEVHVAVMDGRTPLLSLKGRLSDGGVVSWAQIADGAVDDELVDKARAVRALAVPVFIAYHAQPADDAEYGEASEFTAAWRHVVETFRAEGVDNAIFVWTLSSGAFFGGVDEWYPGDDWVNWIGATGFNWYTGDPQSQWRPLAAVFGPFYEWASRKGKPLAIVAFASTENASVEAGDPRAKDTWLLDAAQTLQAWPEIQLAIYHHIPGTDEIPDWRFDSSEAAAAAFRTIVGDPYFDASALTLLTP